MGATGTALALVWLATAAGSQPNRGAPHLGYAYPAGARQGAALRVTVGGQALQGVEGVLVSGQGVQGTVVEYIRPLTNQQLGDIAKHLRAITQQRLGEARGRAAPQPKPLRSEGGEGNEKEPLPELPDHPLLRGLEQKTLAELAALRDVLFNPKRQPNLQIAETVTLDVVVDPAAAPGDRELRLQSPTGLTNPLIFQVGDLPEAWEDEPNDPVPTRLKTAALALPVTLNGQIEPGDIDRFRLQATAGQRLVVRAQARHLVPYLADAVPGWFQATVALYDPGGKEVAYADDYRFDPDPVLFYEVPTDGEYDVEVRDSIYRGREDFVYRVEVGELPFITQLFPLGGAVGSRTVAALGGWNLPPQTLALDTQPGGEALRRAGLTVGDRRSNLVPYAVDTLPEVMESEPNDDGKQAQRVDLPSIVNGRIGRSGEVDVFQITGKAGDPIVAEVLARRLHSPLDSLLRLTGASGKVLAWNDDREDKGMGLETHHADSYLTAKLPLDGLYRVEVRDSAGHGGEAYAYRLRVSAPRPDFALRVTPSGVNVLAGRATPIDVHVLRQDGFDGEIEVALRDAPAGFALSGGRIPAGLDGVHMTLSAPQAWIKAPFALQLEGRATIGGQTVTRPVVPADDLMQAFIYRHLVPAQQFLAQVSRPPRFLPTVALASPGPVVIPAGGTAEVRLTTAALPILADIEVELLDPPAGISVRQVSPVPGGLALVLQADGQRVPAGYANNLVVEAFTQVERKDKDGKPTGRKFRAPLGALPAIPFEIGPE
ncbi:MAG: hypothetical protein FJX74_07950 [Armatimonadetes bacterium]|nr:hypothetical protein [Armatimonadota bacterium]